MITKKQLEAIIRAVGEGGDRDDEISEEEVIAILRDHAVHLLALANAAP